MSSKSRVSFLRKPIHKIPCHHLDCNTILHTRSYNQKYCHKHSYMSRVKKHHKRNLKERQKTMSCPYGHFSKITKRNCLKCGEPFGSITKFHRVCDPCNQINDNLVERTKNLDTSYFFMFDEYEHEYNTSW